jgi:hypothetical protein
MRRPGVMFYRMKRSPIPKGFKANAETQSLAIRRQLGLSAIVACPARLVAGWYNVIVTPLQCLPRVAQDNLQDLFPDADIVSRSAAHLSSRSCGFSAIAVVISDYKMIVFNADNSPERQESDIMHEMSHIICEHPGDCLQLNADIGIRKYDAQCEEEAKWLGATLQIPDKGIFELVKRGYSTEQIANIYGCSLDMAIYRRRILAIDRRLSYIRN